MDNDDQSEMGTWIRTSEAVIAKVTADLDIVKAEVASLSSKHTKSSRLNDKRDNRVQDLEDLLVKIQEDVKSFDSVTKSIVDRALRHRKALRDWVNKELIKNKVAHTSLKNRLGKTERDMQAEVESNRRVVQDILSCDEKINELQASVSNLEFENGQLRDQLDEITALVKNQGDLQMSDNASVGSSSATLGDELDSCTSQLESLSIHGVPKDNSYSVEKLPQRELYRDDEVSASTGLQPNTQESLSTHSAPKDGPYPVEKLPQRELYHDDEVSASTELQPNTQDSIGLCRLPHEKSPPEGLLAAEPVDDIPQSQKTMISLAKVAIKSDRLPSASWPSVRDQFQLKARLLELKTLCSYYCVSYGTATAGSSSLLAVLVIFLLVWGRSSLFWARGLDIEWVDRPIYYALTKQSTLYSM
ncbi:hypothetical protein BJ138DRAFT_1119274 [Hygrophoropsis aurantiaca]|uniref:Uncharacterized protein n=1 Tax=Hygrophoropsis aurantiaca TaxID=72124 RepID=A0ACB7ZU42_9AGAM|nr:hypothetical protein BJ138DRAFT_1119274 [Hygrophoropsis aurantiaca]